jgi:hypothetical protein
MSRPTFLIHPSANPPLPEPVRIRIVVKRTLDAEVRKRSVFPPVEYKDMRMIKGTPEDMAESISPISPLFHNLRITEQGRFIVRRKGGLFIITESRQRENLRSGGDEFAGTGHCPCDIHPKKLPPAVFFHITDRYVIERGSIHMYIIGRIFFDIFDD